MCLVNKYSVNKNVFLKEHIQMCDAESALTRPVQLTRQENEVKKDEGADRRALQDQKQGKNAK